MSDLINAGLYKVKKNPVFWIVMVASVISGVVFTVMSSDSYDDMFIVPIYVLIAIFVSLICGREYSDGTIRNKVVCGHSKGIIYASTLIINCGVSLFMAVLFSVVHLMLRLTVFPIESVLTTGDWANIFFAFVLGGLVYTVTFTLISMLVSNKALSAIINLVLVIVVMFASYQLEFLANQPEFIEIEDAFNNVQLTQEEVKAVQNGTFDGSYYYETLDNGNVVFYKYDSDITQVPNPNHLKNPFNTIIGTIDKILPHGQVNFYVSYMTGSIIYRDGIVPAIERDNSETARQMPIYSMITVLLLSVIGYISFRKKELK
ncbi:MAG: ABC transporter permease subunit [Lachnospiraceae bacterium]|nr:ABC transporter permease subunit [Lachnospiraceae bacterium]